MFSLMCGMYSYLTEKPEYKILMIGIEESGKTTFLEQSKHIYKPNYKPMKYPKYMPTIGLNIGRFETSSKKMLLWDLGGQRNLRQIWTKYYSDADALIFVFDAGSSEERLKEARDCFESAKREIGNCPVLLIANRMKVESSHSLSEISDIFLSNIKTDDTLNPCKLFAASSLTGAGVKEAMEWLVSVL